MRELSVYYCQKCGYYGYYHLSKHAICPKCHTQMEYLPMSRQDFSNLSSQEQSDLLADRIITSSSSYVARIVAPHKANNNREIIAHMSERISELETENAKLTESVEWMHQRIWDLVRKTKGIGTENHKSSDGSS